MAKVGNIGVWQTGINVEESYRGLTPLDLPT